MESETRSILHKKFQYNDCLGSSSAKSAINRYLIRFQYNDCLGSSG